MVQDSSRFLDVEKGEAGTNSVSARESQPEASAKPKFAAFPRLRFGL